MLWLNRSRLTCHLYRNQLVACIFVPFLKQVVGNLVSKAKGLNGFMASQRFALVAKEEAF